MNNYKLLIVLLCVALCGSRSAVAQTTADGCIRMGIEEMFRLADENSKQLRPLHSGINEAEEGVRVANANKLPDINASLSFSYLGNGFTTDRDFSDFQSAPMPHFGNNFALEASQVVYAGGAITNGVKMAELQQQMAVQEYEATRNSVRFIVLGYYLDLYKYRNLKSVFEKNIEQTMEVIKEMKAKQSVGVVLKNDITRYELMLSNLELSLTQIDNGISILNTNLTTTLGLPKGIEVLPDTTIINRVLPSSGVGYWTDNALANSPSLKCAEIGISINETKEKLVNADRLPHIALFAGYKMDGPITIEVPPIDRNFNYWYVGVGVSYNLSSLFKTNKARSQSRIATRRAREEYSAVGQQISLAVNADYTKYVEAYSELQTQQKSVELANQNYDVIYNRYRNDIALITDMLDAANSKLAAEQQLVNAQINIIYYYYKLHHTSGTL